MSNPSVIAELQRIAEENGGELRAGDVVEAARPETSPLHSQFEWDDTEAAHKWRIEQARKLIRVSVQYVGSGDSRTVTRVFVSLTPDRQAEGGCYRTTAAVMSNDQHRAQLLADAFAEMEKFKKKYAELRELSEVFASMDRVKRQEASFDSRMPWPKDHQTVRPEDALRRRTV